MKHYKLIISDYDGTLAGRDGRISKRVSDAIKKWVAEGHDFSIATGKNYLRIKDHIENLGLKVPQIVMAGAEVVAPNGAKLFTNHMDKEVASDFIQFMDQHGYGLIVDVDEHYYLNSKANFTLESPYITILPLEKFEPRAVAKILVRFDDKTFDETEKFYHDELLQRYPDLHFIKTHGPAGKGWDVTSLKSTKHLAALELMKMLGLKREEVVAVGDGYNDVPLFEACGYRVALEGAPEDLRAIADKVVPSYKEDGVAVLIEELLHNENA